MIIYNFILIVIIKAEKCYLGGTLECSSNCPPCQIFSDGKLSCYEKTNGTCPKWPNMKDVELDKKAATNNTISTNTTSAPIPTSIKEIEEVKVDKKINFTSVNTNENSMKTESKTSDSVVVYKTKKITELIRPTNVVTEPLKEPDLDQEFNTLVNESVSTIKIKVLRQSEIDENSSSKLHTNLIFFWLLT